VDPDGHCIWDLGVGEGAALYAAGAATVTTAAYLMTPQGKESARAFFTGVAAGVGALINKFSQSNDEKAAPPPGPLPANPEALKEEGHHDTSHPEASAAGHRTFENPQTGDKVRFDQGKPGAPGHEGTDHYHRYNRKTCTARV
jgi:hypothetical protein